MRKRFGFYILYIFLFFIQVIMLFPLDPLKPMDYYQHDKWTEDNGLLMNSVLCILQSDDGYLWLGTENGLVRFDGIEFEDTDLASQPALTKTTIRYLHQDRQGTLWIATRGNGLIRRKSDSGTNVFEAVTTGTGLLSDLVNHLMESSDGLLWIATNYGLNYRDGEKLSSINLTDDSRPIHVNAALEDRLGRIWVGSRDEGVYLIQRRSQQFLVSRYPSERPLTVTCLLEDKRGIIYWGTENEGLKVIRSQAQRNKQVETLLPGNTILNLFEDRSSNIWIGTYNNGLHVIPSGHNQPLHYHDADIIKSNSIRSIYEDREGTLWLGTYNDGLHALRNSKLITYNNKMGLSTNILWGVFQDSSSTIWVGSRGYGVHRLDKKTDRFSALTTKDGLSSNNVVAFAEIPEGTLWFGTIGGGVNRFQDGRFRLFSQRDGLSDNSIRVLYVDDEGTLWAGSVGGGIYFFRDERFIEYARVNVRINHITKDSDNTLWAGTYGGGLYAIKNGNITAFTKKNGLSHNVISDIVEDYKEKGLMWIGTFGGGLNFYKNGSFTAVLKKHGLPDNVIYSIREDIHRNFWIGSNNGIFCISRRDLEDLASGRIKHISPFLVGKEDGMKSTECNGAVQPSSWRSEDGRLWFPTIRGLAVLDPGNIYENKLPPPVQIKQILVDEKPMTFSNNSASRSTEPNPAHPDASSTATAFTPHLELSPGWSRLSIHYTALSFIVPKKIRFKYKLDGYDEGWSEATSRRSVQYGSIPPGDYRFRVIACNSDGIWNKEGTILNIRIGARFYQTITFKILFPLLLAALIFAIFMMMKSKISIRWAKKKYNYIGLESKEVDGYRRKLINLFEEKKVFLDANLTLKSLSAQLHISQSVLSMIINKHMNKNFFELVNYYRIKEASQLLLSPENKDKSILDVAYSVGFNSKSSFNRAFKHFTQMTPREFKKNGSTETAQK
jgi:ligand-binding sensor domain-containing protein/AraC-like DNA-binding protein